MLDFYGLRTGFRSRSSPDAVMGPGVLSARAATGETNSPYLFAVDGAPVETAPVPSTGPGGIDDQAHST